MTVCANVKIKKSICMVTYGFVTTSCDHCAQVHHWQVRLHDKLEGSSLAQAFQNVLGQTKLRCELLFSTCEKKNPPNESFDANWRKLRARDQSHTFSGVRKDPNTYSSVIFAARFTKMLVCWGSAVKLNRSESPSKKSCCNCPSPISGLPKALALS